MKFVEKNDTPMEAAQGNSEVRKFMAKVCKTLHARKSDILSLSSAREQTAFVLFQRYSWGEMIMLNVLLRQNCRLNKDEMLGMLSNDALIINLFLQLLQEEA